MLGKARKKIGKISINLNVCLRDFGMAEILGKAKRMGKISVKMPCFSERLRDGENPEERGKKPGKISIKFRCLSERLRDGENHGKRKKTQNK